MCDRESDHLCRDEIDDDLDWEDVDDLEDDEDEYDDDDNWDNTCYPSEPPNPQVMP